MSEGFANAASTTLNGAINNSVTSITVTSATGFPTEVPFRIRVHSDGTNNEIMTVTAGAGTTTWTVERASEAYAGTQTAVSHANAEAVDHVLTAGALRSITAEQSFVGAKAVRTTTQTINEDTYTSIEFNANDEFDTDNFHDTVTENEKVIIPAGFSGRYLIIASVGWTTNADNYRGLVIRKNGLDGAGDSLKQDWVRAVDGLQTHQTTETIVDLVEGDFIAVDVYHSVTTSLTIVSAHLEVYKLESGGLGKGIGARVHRTTSQTGITTQTAITFNAEDFDTDGFHSTSLNTERFTIPPGLGGLYIIIGQLYFANIGLATNYVHGRILKNAGAINLATVRHSRAGNNDNTLIDLVAISRLEAGDYVVLTAESDDASFDINSSGTGSGGGLPSFQIARLDSGGNGYTANKWGAGTTFPSGAVTGDRWTRTDRNIDYFYDGTRWLSTQIFMYTGSMPEELMPVATSGRAIVRWPTWDLTYDTYLLECRMNIVVTTTNNGSNFWTLTVDEFDGSSFTQLATVNTSADTADIHTLKTLSLNTLLASGSFNIAIRVTKTSSPGTIYCNAMLSYRLVG